MRNNLEVTMWSKAFIHSLSPSLPPSIPPSLVKANIISLMRQIQLLGFKKMEFYDLWSSMFYIFNVPSERQHTEINKYLLN